MTPEQLQGMIAGGETLQVEFKSEEKQRLDDVTLVEAVVCLANRSGTEPAYLVVGVENDGRLTGMRPRHEEGGTDLLRLQALIANRTRPSVTVRASLVALNEVPILVIEVPVARQPVGTSDGKYVRRAIGGDGRPACVPFHFHEMQSHQTSRGVLDHSSMVVPEATWEDLDPLEFERYRRRARESRGRGDMAVLDLADRELAKALGAIEVDENIERIRVLGLLLFGREESLQRFLPTHEAAFQVLDGTTVRVNDFFRWPLLRLMEELESRFRARNQETEMIAGMLRIGIPDYPERAFREAIANALVHRDYTRSGAVHVQWHPERLVVSNPGGFPEGVRLDNLLVTPPRPRNPVLADAFKRAGIVERTGRGIDTIYYEQLRNGRPAPSYDASSGTDVVLMVPGGEANLEFARLVTEENRANRLLSLEELLLLNRMWLDRQVDVVDAAQVLQRTESEARGTLQRLVEAGLAEARGSGRALAYHLSAGTYRRLGESAAYVRQRGFEPIQQEQMVVQYIEKHGKVTRKEVAELCRISPPQAYRLLQKIESKGLITKTAKRGRSVQYTKKHG